MLIPLGNIRRARVVPVAASKHGKALGQVRKDLVLKMANELLRSPTYGGVQLRLADAIGVKQPHLSRVLAGKAEVGMSFVAGIAKLCGVPLASLLDDGSPAVVLELDERYHNRGLAAAGARAMGYPEQAIRPVQSVSLKSDADLTVDQWFDMIRAEKFRLERLAPREDGEPELTAEEREKATADLREQAERETRESEARSKAKRAKPPTPPSDPAA